MIKPEILSLITSLSEKYSVDKVLILAIIKQESNWNKWSYRYEPHYNELVDVPVFARSLNISVDSERMGQMTSWGLMQIIGANTRAMGYTGILTQLCDPFVGLEYSVRLLKKLQDRYGNMSDVISAYNQGNVRKSWTGGYKNQDYVDSVLKIYNEIKNAKQSI